MEQKENINNEEEKQNLEEEEYDEEDEEEKETEKKENENKNEENNENKEKENEDNKDKKEEQVSKEICEEKNIENNTIKYSKEEQNDEKEKISLNPQNLGEKVENNEQKEENNEKKDILEKEENIILMDKKENNENKENINNNNKEEKNKSEIQNENDETNITLKNNINLEKKEEEEEEKEEEDKDSISTYILKYTRKENESRESSYDKELIKSKHCLFMIEFKILKGKKENYLLIYCHEIAAIYFDEIYEKKYSIKDLYKENRHFRIFDDIEEAKQIIDEILNNNNSNSKKIFIDLQENTFRLHLNITFFDKEKEVIFNVPKKNINDKERIRLLPEFLKEIQIKMNHLEEDNKKLKIGNKSLNESEVINSGARLNISGDGDNDFLDSKNDKKNKSTIGKGYKKKLIKK